MSPPESSLGWIRRKHAVIAAFTIVMIAVHLGLRFGLDVDPDPTALPLHTLPLLGALVFGGTPLVWDLLKKLLERDFGSDLLAGISIVTSVLLGEYLAGSLVVLMLSGGEALEAYAIRSASSVLHALAARLPSVAHRRHGATVRDVSLDALEVEDEVLIYPHEVCPVDGTVIEGHSVMDESYLTGEPYLMSKSPGSSVLSGAVNGDSVLTIRADKRAVDSRYSKIMAVMRASEQRRPRLRRLGDQLGAVYTPVAVVIGIAAWIATGDPVRFLAVMVVATPCPLLIAIPITIIGSVSLAAKRAIIVRDPVALEKIDTCRTVVFDKTGTLTYGTPNLTEQIIHEGFDGREVLSLVASLERYSKHPLASAIIEAGKKAGVAIREAEQLSEKPGQGLTAQIDGRQVRILSRKQVLDENPNADLPEAGSGLECLVLIDNTYVATYRFRDTPRLDGKPFVHHLGPRHKIERVVLLSGDRESEVRYLAEEVGITEVFFSQSPEDKLRYVEAETKNAPVVFVGDGINDAPALAAATVGIAFGQNSDITSEAAGVIVMDSSLEKVDEFLHIGKRMRRIALQSAIGGMTLSVVCMFIAAAGYLPPVAGAITQEVIDVVAVLNALRVAIPPKKLSDF